MPENSTLDQMINSKIGKLSPELQLMFREVLNTKPSQSATQAKEIKDIERTNTLRKLKTAQTVEDEDKLKEYINKYNQSAKVATGIHETNKYDEETKKYTKEYNFPEEVREPAIKQQKSYSDSLKLWYEWKDLQNRGIKISLPEFRAYKEERDANTTNVIEETANKMIANGYSPKNVEMFKRIAISQVLKGKKNPSEALIIAAKMINETNPIGK